VAVPVAGLRSLIGLLRDRDFALLWWGGFVSHVGNGFTMVAVGWLLVHERGSPRDFGLYLLSFEVAAIVGGLLLTGVMDAYSRRRLMILDSVVRGIAVAAIPAADLFADAGLTVILASGVLLGFFSPTADVGQRAMVVDLLDESRLTAANAAEGVQWTAAWLIGPALGGVLVAAIGTFSTLWIDALTFFVFAGTLAAMSPRADRLPDRLKARESYFTDLREGFAYVRRERLMWTIIQLTAGARLVEGIFVIALPVMVSGAGADAHVLGLIYAAGGAGSLLGSLLTAGLRLPFTLTRSVTICAAVGAVATLIIALSLPLWLVAFVFFLETTITAPWNIYILTLRQRVPPPELVGRVLSVTMLLNAAGQPGGSALGGLLIAPLGVPTLLAASGVFQLANAGASLLSRRWRDFPMRDGEEPAPEPLGPAAEVAAEVRP
jgi:predicted MFS family arabinose efflux permease